MVLLVLGRPQQLNLDVQLPVRLKVDPDLMKRLLGLADEVGEGELAVGDEVVGGNGGAASGLDYWREKLGQKSLIGFKLHLWNTVNPISSAERSRSVEKVSFHSGSRTFDFVVVRSTNTSSTSG